MTMTLGQFKQQASHKVGRFTTQKNILYINDKRLSFIALSQYFRFWD